jgi:GNAT superfamily N-acetyltransferase
METTTRLLGAGDTLELERFLDLHRDSSMILRSNLRRTGIVYEGKAQQGTYIAAFEQAEIVGVAAHYWNGMVFLQAPADVERLVPVCVQASGRTVKGFGGPLEQVRRARRALNLETAEARLDQDETLYALDLAKLVVPGSPVQCRAPTKDDHDTLSRWRAAYEVETLGSDDSADTRARSERVMADVIAGGDARVALGESDELVSFSAFNSALPDMVQLGGIYTPPEVRRRGYARAAVAATLLGARDRGVTRAVLFANAPDAIRCYTALGFRRIGDYGLVLLK